MHRYEIPLFYFLTFAPSWLIWGSAIAQQRGLLTFRLPEPLAFFSATPAAFLVASVFEGWPGIRDLLRRMVRWRVGLQWYATAVLLPIGLYLLAAGAYRLFGGNVPIGPFSHSRLLEGASRYFVAFTLFMLSTLFALLTVEAGWRGFALPRLEVKYRALTASLIVGLLMSVWWTPLFLIPGTWHLTSPYIGFVLAITAGSVLLTWVYNSTDGSVLLTSILDGAGGVAAFYVGIVYRDAQASWVLTAVVCIAAVIVVALVGSDRLSRTNRVDYLPVPPQQ